MKRAIEEVSGEASDVSSLTLVIEFVTHIAKVSHIVNDKL